MCFYYATQTMILYLRPYFELHQLLLIMFGLHLKRMLTFGVISVCLPVCTLPTLCEINVFIILSACSLTLLTYEQAALSETVVLSVLAYQAVHSFHVSVQ